MGTLRRLLGCGLLVCLSACGGADSSTTTLSGPGVQAGGKGVELGTAPMQTANNMALVIDGGPGGLFSLGQANILFADVTICAPGSRSNCTTIDHVQVDTGSVGLRLLASKLSALHLPALGLSLDGATGQVQNARECYPFVTGGFWGPNVLADVGLGLKWANALPIQLIDDDPASLVKPPLDCSNAVSGQILNSASMLGANGILGVGSVTVDCGLTCLQGDYRGTYIQYYSCPANASSNLQCVAAAVPSNAQVFNPIAAFDTDNNGMVINLPAVSGVGAAVVHGEMVFGINTQSNNQLPANAQTVHLGVDWVHAPDSYLNITTLYQGQTLLNSYLDTGSNGFFFTDPGVPKCSGSSWYCPATAQSLNAVLTDGALIASSQVAVNVPLGNADAYFSTNNNAFGGLAGVYSGQTKDSFVWGLPFFYGRRVFLSIWTQSGAGAGPWYAF